MFEIPSVQVSFLLFCFRRLLIYLEMFCTNFNILRLYDILVVLINGMNNCECI